MRSEVTPAHLAGYLEASARRWPDRTAVVNPDGTSITYVELNRRADAFAAFLHARGVAAGDRVGIMVPKSIAGVVALFGTGHRQLSPTPRGRPRRALGTRHRSIPRHQAGGEGSRRRRASGIGVCRGHADLRALEQDRARPEVRWRTQGQADAGEDWQRQLAAAEKGGGAGGRGSCVRHAAAPSGPRGPAWDRVSA